MYRAELEATVLSEEVVVTCHLWSVSPLFFHHELFSLLFCTCHIRRYQERGCKLPLAVLGGRMVSRDPCEPAGNNKVFCKDL
ncbi:hypothetical protein AV530_013417 [Patagioenas fasciata monilis]|uniref:Uncharacterized protein n=1 Tax=Patagioenas fasciata monilis TaxID=372326 RepID=A0A1V4JPB1_PATFA|nr:hypothetical protein AV530_013417 [Patagioenas fasciata monilis]